MNLLMRRLFIIRKDLHLSDGKLAAMVGHCAEAYWSNLIKMHTRKESSNVFSCVDFKDITKPLLYKRNDLCTLSESAFYRGDKVFYAEKNEDGVFLEVAPKYSYVTSIELDKDIYEDYLEGSFVKIICEAKNLTQLLKVVDKAIALGLKENEDFGFINDKCLTELTPENADGTCTVGVWFKPLNDEIAKELSSNYRLYSSNEVNNFISETVSSNDTIIPNDTIEFDELSFYNFKLDGGCHLCGTQRCLGSYEEIKDAPCGTFVDWLKEKEGKS